MRRLTAAGLVLGGILFLTACVPGSEPTSQTGSPIFDRARTAADELPATVDGNVDPNTRRYAGEDSAGNEYWVTNETDSNIECIVYVPPDDAENLVFCSGPGLSATTADGRVIEFASSPSQLSRDNAELVGDTLLVKAPNS